jgi:hypothetical protein
MAITRVDFTEWLPDQPGVIGALTNAQNVVPKAVGYGPFPIEEDYSGSASENLNNVVAAKTPNGSTQLVASGSTKLFLLNATDLSLEDVSGTTYNSVNKWSFAKFGNFLIAAGEANTLQYADLATTFSFSDIDASAPKAKLVTVVRDFVVVGNTNTASNEVRWSGINNPQTWTPSAVTQSDFQELPDGGEVRGLTGGEFGLVLLEKSIVRMSYVGTPLIFQFDNITRNIGCYETNSVVQWGGITYFLSDDGFYACNGQALEAIGAEKVNRYFWSTLEESRLGEMSAAVDPFRSLVVWGYPSLDNTYRLLIYHLNTKRWSFADTNINRVADVATPGTTLEQLDSISASLDALAVSLDDRQWLGGKFVFAGVRGDKIITFGGQNKSARITTADLSAGENMSMVTLARPVVDNGLASVAVSSRFNLSEAVSFGPEIPANSENRVGLRSLGRYHRLRVIPSNNWQTAIGVEVDIQPAGMR